MSKRETVNNLDLLAAQPIDDTNPMKILYREVFDSSFKQAKQWYDDETAYDVTMDLFLRKVQSFIKAGCYGPRSFSHNFRNHKAG